MLPLISSIDEYSSGSPVLPLTPYNVFVLVVILAAYYTLLDVIPQHLIRFLLRYASRDVIF